MSDGGTVMHMFFFLLLYNAHPCAISSLSHHYLLNSGGKKLFILKWMGTKGIYNLGVQSFDDHGINKTRVV